MKQFENLATHLTFLGQAQQQAAARQRQDQMENEIHDIFQRAQVDNVNIAFIDDLEGMSESSDHDASPSSQNSSVDVS